MGAPFGSLLLASVPVSRCCFTAWTFPTRTAVQMSISGGESGWAGLEVAGSGEVFVVGDVPSSVGGPSAQPMATRTTTHNKCHLGVFITFLQVFSRPSPAANIVRQSIHSHGQLTDANIAIETIFRPNWRSRCGLLMLICFQICVLEDSTGLFLDTRLGRKQKWSDSRQHHFAWCSRPLIRTEFHHTQPRWNRPACQLEERN